jgi:parallel beta-helix repeat protein
MDAGGDGVQIDVDVCCDESNSTSSVQVNGNDDVIGGDDGIEVDVDLGCGDGNDSVVEVNNNNRVEGETDDGVDVDVDVGDVGSGCDNDDQSDENTSLVQVNGNDDIDGGGAEGVEVDNDTGGDSGNGDDNVSTTEVIGNSGITGSSEGVEIDSDSGCESCSDADANITVVKVSENENITGAGAEGVNVSADSGVEEFPGDIGSSCCGGADNDADDNRTEVTANDNGNITGNGDDGLELDLQSGGSTSGSIRNENEATISGNGSLTGRSSASGDGLDLEMDVCCDAANTNTANIVGNADITGRNDGGIEVTLCCSFNVVNILDNGQIRGNGDDGIDINVDDESLDLTDGVQPCPQECGLWSSVTILTIGDGPDADDLGNDIFNSEEQGIDIRAGAMQFPTTTGATLKSLISKNRIHDNRDDGIEIENSSGLNITENEIFSNGDDPSLDAGVKVTTDCCGFPINLLPGNANTISMNSIHDNIGLGIDLVGDEDKLDADGETGVGCNPHPGTNPGDVAVSPNDCIPFPTITIIAAGDKVGGTACSGCHVELFLADATPADQTGPLNRQHGEGTKFLVRGTADVAGNFSIILPCGEAAGDITATATDKSKNTSEFAANAPMLGTRSCATDTPTVTNTNTPAPTATQGPPTATFTPVPPAATPTATEPTKDCGDVNDDGNVNSIDAQLILQLTAALIDTLVNSASADVNASGEISSVDAALILQKEAGLIPQSALVCGA